MGLNNAHRDSCENSPNKSAYKLLLAVEKQTRRDAVAPKERKRMFTLTPISDEDRPWHCGTKGGTHSVQRRSTEVPPNPSTARTVRRIVSRRLDRRSLPCRSTGRRLGRRHPRISRWMLRPEVNQRNQLLANSQNPTNNPPWREIDEQRQTIQHSDDGS